MHAFRALVPVGSMLWRFLPACAMTDHDSRTQLGAATEALLDDQFYQAMKALRALLPREARLMAGGRT